MEETNYLTNKTILVTGGTGSFGRGLVKRVLTEYDCERVIVFSRDEWKQWEMQRSDPVFSDPRLQFVIGDVRDRDRLWRVFRGVDLVVHAAALKQVPAAEHNPTEFVKTNVFGAMNVIDAAIDGGVEKVVALSTDKAVNPVNLYGATKLCADKLFVAADPRGLGGDTKFAVVRYGNVLGSRGSIIPLWRKMVREGAQAIPVTDPRMTRFWVTLEQAVDFVIRCFGMMDGGEIFVPKVPSMRIMDLAEVIAPTVEKSICGIREGEKLHELLISADDARHTYDFDAYYVIVPEIGHERITERYEDRRLPEDFVYASDRNPQWLSVEELQHLFDSNLSDALG